MKIAVKMNVIECIKYSSLTHQINYSSNKNKKKYEIIRKKKNSKCVKVCRAQGISPAFK